jgi:hypothetical protein
MPVESGYTSPDAVLMGTFLEHPPYTSGTMKRRREQNVIQD